MGADQLIGAVERNVKEYLELLEGEPSVRDRWVLLMMLMLMLHQEEQMNGRSRRHKAMDVYTRGMAGANALRVDVILLEK
jgi:hypothetical protein